MPAIYQLVKAWKPKLVSGTSRGTGQTGSNLRKGGATPDLSGTLVQGKFAPTNSIPRIRTLQHERTDSTECLHWSKEVDANTIELGDRSSSTSPYAKRYPVGQAL